MSKPPEIPHGLVGQLPTTHRITGLPFYPQVEDQCGPASLATMLSARGLQVSPESLRGKIYIPGKEGTLTTEMVARARRYGMLVYPLRPELADIFIEISAGNPVLVMQNLGFDWLPRWHFSIVTGYDLDRELVVLRSGHKAYREVGFDLFLKTWERALRWAVVINRPDQLPATADESSYIAAASELELVDELAAALMAYETAMTRWPTSGQAYFGVGNTAYAMGQFDRAREMYSAYVEMRPSAAAGWNNLAYSLMRLRCRTESLQALNCALQLEPGNPAFLDSRRELSAQTESVSTVFCRVPRC